MIEFIEIVKQYGPLAAITIVFLWQSVVRENRMSRRLDLTEDHVRILLSTTINRNSIALERFTAVIALKPCGVNRDRVSPDAAYRGVTAVKPLAPVLRASQRQRRDIRFQNGCWRFFPYSANEPAGPEFPTLLDALAWSGLSRARDFSKPNDAPFPPLVAPLTRRPGELELRKIPTIVCTADPPGPRAAIYAARRDRIRRQLDGYGFNNWRFLCGPTWQFDLPDHVRDCSPHCTLHSRICAENDPPLLVLEDDAEPAWLPTHFLPPPDADRLHLGGDSHGVDLSRLLALKSGGVWRRHVGYRWQPYSRDWFREAGMLAFHAVLYLSRGIMAKIAEYLRGKTGAVDAVVSELDSQFRVYSPTRCWWWQNDGHNGPWSYDFVPRDLRDPNYPRKPP